MVDLAPEGAVHTPRSGRIPRRGTPTDLAQGGSKAEVIRRAIATYKYLKAEVADPESSKLLAIMGCEAKIENHIILP